MTNLRSFPHLVFIVAETDTGDVLRAPSLCPNPGIQRSPAHSLAFLLHSQRTTDAHARQLQPLSPTATRPPPACRSK